MSSKKSSWFKSVFDHQSTDSIASVEPVQKKLKLSADSSRSENNTSLWQSPPSATPVPASVKLVHTDFKSSNWIENFAPQKPDDLSVHSKKIEEIQNWLEQAERNRKQLPGPILLVTGPSGSGKTITIQLIAKELGYEINEWVNPVDVEQCRSYRANADVDTYTESQTDLFSQFLFKASRYRSVFQTHNKRLVLVEDFPNIFLKDTGSFHEILGNYRIYAKSPIVFVVTDTKSKKLNIAYNLFGDAVQQEHRFTHISFNAVSTTLVRKGLKRIASLMSHASMCAFYKLPTSDLIESIILTSQGDIRNAVINLHFASQKHSDGLTTEAAKANSKKTNKNRKLKSVGCDESITLFHALGRVLNPKYQKSVNETCRLLHSPEQLSDDFSSQPHHFVKMLHSNYAGHFKNIDDLANTANMLSCSDVLMSEWREDVMSTIGLNITIRATMVCNRTPASGWLPIKGQKKYESRNLEEEIRELNIGQSLTAKVLACDYRTYAKLIRSVSK